MDDVASKEGRTVLFVSHNMAIIRNLCNRGILISKGKIQHSGDVEDVITLYEYENPNEGSQWINPKDNSDCTGAYFDIETVSVLDSKMNLKKIFYNSEKVLIKIEFFIKEVSSQMKIQLYFIKYSEIAFTYPIFVFEKYKVSTGKHTLFCEIPAYLLNSGNYFITVEGSLYNIEMIAYHDHILNFEVVLDRVEFMPHLESVPGYVFPLLNWYLKE